MARLGRRAGFRQCGERPPHPLEILGMVLQPLLDLREASPGFVRIVPVPFEFRDPFPLLEQMTFAVGHESLRFGEEFKDADAVGHDGRMCC